MKNLKRFLSRLIPKCRCRSPYFEVKDSTLKCRNCGKPIAKGCVENGYK